MLDRREPFYDAPLPGPPLTEPEDGSSHGRLAGGCLAACPVKVDGAPCLKTCTLSNGHYGPHKCPEGHTWR